MDPVACMLDSLKLFSKFIISGNREYKINLLMFLGHYSNWRLKGGFNPPDIEYGDKTMSGDEWFDHIMNTL